MLKKKVSFLPVCLCFLALFAEAQPAILVKATLFRKDTFSIEKFGAQAGGLYLNTKSINDAIEACNKRGGGVVVIPAGLWLTGPIVLRSNVNLHLKQNALLQFSPDFDQYPLVKTNWEGLPQMRNQSPISANDASNIAITGKGIIDGAGNAWRMVKKDKLTNSQWTKLLASGGVLSDDGKTWYPTARSLEGSRRKNPGVIAPGRTQASYDSVKDFLRPNLVVLTNCSVVLLEGVTFRNSPAWSLHPLMSNHLTVRNIRVENPWYAQNGDGIDVESCRYVLIESSVFDVGDDGICIKSGRDEEGRKRGMPTQDVVIRNCTVYHAHGGFVIGSEMSGGARNIYVSNCTFIGTDIGLRFKTTRGRGGIVENIFIDDINMLDIVGEAILFDMYYAAQDPIVLAGENRQAPKVETMPVTEATPQFRKISIKKVYCFGAEKAIFIRGLPEMNVQDITMQDMIIQSKTGMYCTEASAIQLNNVQLMTKESNPVLFIHNSTNIELNQFVYSQGAALLLEVSGEKTKSIRFINTDPSRATEKIRWSGGASDKSVVGIK